MTQITMHHCKPISITYSQSTDKKAAKYTISLVGLKKHYPVPEDVSNRSDELSHLLTQFYQDINSELPKNGFDVFTMGADFIAIPKQN